MIFVKQTQTQLKLLHRPYLVWIVAGSLMLGVPSLILLIYLNYSWIIYLWWMPLFFPSIVILGFFGLIFAGQVVTYQFDQDSNSLIIKRRSLLNTKVIWHSLADILDIQVQSTSWYHDETANYQIVIVLKSGNKLTLSFGLVSAREKLKTVNIIRKFLGMQPQKLGW